MRTSNLTRAGLDYPPAPRISPPGSVRRNTSTKDALDIEKYLKRCLQLAADRRREERARPKTILFGTVSPLSSADHLSEGLQFQWMDNHVDFITP